MMHFRTPLALAALAALLSACGGGGGGSSPIPSSGGSGSSPTQPAQKTGPASLTITIPPPSKQNTHFRPGYISAATQSMTVGLVSGSTTTSLVTVNLTQSSPNCTVPAGGGLQCAATVQAPFGIDTFAISTYSGLNGTGNVLSTGEVSATLTAGGTEPTVALSLNGVPNTVSIALGTATLPVGYSGSTSVIVQAYDASNNLIIGPGLFSTPITLAITGDPYSTLSISYGPLQSPPQTSITSPGQVATLSYTGGSVVAATITPSASGLTSATGASFAATGVSMNEFPAQYSYNCEGAEAETLYPYGVAALSGGTAAVLFDEFSLGCTEESTPYSIAIVSPNGLQSNFFAGDTSDPYNPGSLPASQPGITWVHTMNTGIETDEGEAYSDLAAGPNGTVYYMASFSTSSYPPSSTCAEGGSASSGLIGRLNPAMGTTNETILHGYPYQIKSDSTGNVYFVEYEGTCDATEDNLLDGTSNFQYAVGEITTLGAVTETAVSTIGIGSSFYPGDMAVAPNGTAMYLADDNDPGHIIMLPISGGVFGAAVEANEPTAYDPVAIAAGADGSVAWFADFDEGDHYYWGYAPSGASLSTATMHEQALPGTYFEAESMTSADGSYFAADDEEGSGFVRMANVTSGSPLVSSIPVPYNDDELPYFAAVSAGGGYIWGVDDEEGGIYSLQYGEPRAGVVNPSLVHGRIIEGQRNTHRRTRAHARPTVGKPFKP